MPERVPDILINCDELDCPCENKCCQYCMEQMGCPHRCQVVRYKEKVYGSNWTIIRELEKLAGATGNWLVAVAAEKIRSLTGCSKNRLVN